MSIHTNGFSPDTEHENLSTTELRLDQPRTLTTSEGLALVIRGAGTPVFLMHGIGGSALSCGGLAQELAAEGFQTICWDAPGYGDSKNPKPDVEHAEAALRALDELGVASVHLIGTSWGGVIATRIAAQNPLRVLSVILMDSTRGSGRTEESADNMLARLPELEALGATAFAAKRAAKLVSPMAGEEVVAAVRNDMSRIRIPGYGAAARMMATSDTSEDLKRITTPALVLVGEHDIVTGVAESEVLAELIPGAEFAVVPEAGHAAIQEKPRDVAALILNFWKKSS